MTKNEKVIVDAIDQPDTEADRTIEEEAASVDQFSNDALAFWREYLRSPKRRRAKPYRSRTNK